MVTAIEPVHRAPATGLRAAAVPAAPLKLICPSVRVITPLVSAASEKYSAEMPDPPAVGVAWTALAAGAIVSARSRLATMAALNSSRDSSRSKAALAVRTRLRLRRACVLDIRVPRYKRDLEAGEHRQNSRRSQTPQTVVRGTAE